MSDIALRARGLAKTYSTDGVEAAAIKDLDLDIRHGEYTVIMGSSGSGKSTLLFLLSGLDRPTAGTIDLSGRRIDALGETEMALLRRRGFGFVFQSLNLVSNLSVRENVLAAGYLGSRRREAVRERAAELLAALGIAELAERLPSQISGGQAQRAAMARALVNRPAILVADEPTGALNRASGLALLDCLDKVREGGQTIVMATHDLRGACRGDRVLFLRDGKVGGDLRFSDTESRDSRDLERREQLLFDWLSGRGW